MWSFNHPFSQRKSWVGEGWRWQGSGGWTEVEKRGLGNMGGGGEGIHKISG